MLTVEQIREIAEAKPHKKELERARVHQNRLRFHTETQILKNELSPYINDFERWICTEKPEILPKDKVERFKQLLTCPLPTVKLCEDIKTAWSRVFDGSDAFFRYDFDDPQMAADWEDYRDDEFWKEDGLDAMVNAIDSVWVVDLPKEQEGDYPEPKNLLINPENIIDLSVKKTGECFYVIFSIGELLYVYDDISIRVFDYKGKTIGSLIDEFKHGLGYCPAITFWGEVLNSRNYINHKSPLTTALGDLDWLLVHKVFKKYMDIGNSFPILVKYQSGGDFTDMRPTDNKGRTEGEQLTAGGSLVGPGSVVEVPIPMEGQPDLMSNPLAWISPDIKALEFHVTEDTRLTEYIYKTSVGVDGEQSNDKAKNEKQVVASFENMTTILRKLAKNFERVQTFAEEVIIYLRYGVRPTVSIYYGSKFFLKTSEDLTAEKESVKGDDIMTDAINAELIDTKFKNDPGGKIRAEVINDLDPVPGKTIEEAILIKDAGGISEDAFWMKANLMYCVRRFEREQLPIAQFMKVGDYNKRVELIKNEFKKYYESEKNGSGQSQTGSADQGDREARLSRSDDEREDQSSRPDTSGSEDRD